MEPLTRRGHRREGPIPTTLKLQQKSVWFHPVSPGLQFCCPVFTHFPGDCRRDTDWKTRGIKVAHLWISCQLSSLKRRVTPRKSLQSSFYSGQPGLWGRSRVSSGFCVIVSLLIKVKGVSWIVSLCQTRLLGICCFQVEEMFKDCWVDLTTYYLKLTHCNFTDVPTTNFSHCTQTTALFAFIA